VCTMPVEIVVASQTSQKIDAVKAAVDDVARLKVSVRTYASIREQSKVVAVCLSVFVVSPFAAQLRARVLCAFCVYVCACQLHHNWSNAACTDADINSLRGDSDDTVADHLTHVALGCHASTANDLHS
jgi:hypothetical protein